MKWISWILWIAAAWMAAACHKELCYDHSHETTMEVRFDWSLNPPEESPSMHLALLPTGEEQRDRVEQAFDDPAGGHIVLSRGRYHALAFNRDGDGIELYLDSYDGAYVTTSTTDVVSASTFFGTKAAPLPSGSEGHSVRQQPSLFYADTCSLFTVDMNHTSYLMRPKLLVDTIDVRVEGVKNLDYVVGMSAAISGLSAAVSLSRLEPLEELCIVPMAVDRIGSGTIGGSMLTFGRRVNEQQEEQHTLTIYTILDDGKKYYFNFDVTDQMTEESITPGHLEIDIPDLPIPEPIKEGGFHPELSDWEEVVIDIDM